MLLSELLWKPLPERLPSVKPQRLADRLRELASDIASEIAGSQSSVQDVVERRVRRGFAQALVAEAYQATLAEQDSTHRRPAAFAEAWRTHLATLMDQPIIDLHAWGPHTRDDFDADFAWELLEAASCARQRSIDHATATKGKQVQRGQRVPTFEFSIVGDGSSLGDVIYGVCLPCRVGLLYKIGFPTDWQFCGLGGLALGQLEARHPQPSATRKSSVNRVPAAPPAATAARVTQPAPSS
jgi:hypothetical protein